MNNPVVRYVKGNTFFHRQDPRVKIVFVLALIVSLFLANHLITTTFLALLSIFAFLSTTKSIRVFIRSLYFPVVLFIFFFIFNSITIQPYDPAEDINNISQTKSWLASANSLISQREVFYWNYETNSLEKIQNFFYDFRNQEWTDKNILWYKLGFLKITPISVIRSFSAAMRVFCMILATKVLTYSTHPVLFTKATEDLLWPLSLIKIPVSIFAMVLSIAYRFIPTLLDEAQRIMKAQTSRGIDFKNGGAREKIIALTSLIIPLFVASFNRAWELSESMEARCYDPAKKRTRYRRLSLKLQDYIFLLLVVALLTVVFLIQYNHFKLPYWYAITYQKF